MWAVDYNVQWIFLMVLAWGLTCAFPLRRVVGWVPAATAFWFVATSINACENAAHYANLGEGVATSFRAYSLDSVVKLFLFLVPMIYWRAPRWMGEAFAWLGVGNAIVILGQLALYGCGGGETSACTGVIGNHSMSASFSVVLLPLVVQYRRIFGALSIALVAAAAFMADASVPIGLLAMFMALYSRKAAPFILLVLGAGAWRYGPEFLSSGDRFEMWDFFLTEWKHTLIGEGFGSFAAWAYVRQTIVHVKENSWWLWAHNDWLQAFIEAGVIGGALLLGTVATIMHRLLKSKMHAEAACLVLLSAMMVFNYPLHLAPTALFAAWLGVRGCVCLKTSA